MNEFVLEYIKAPIELEYIDFSAFRFLFLLLRQNTFKDKKQEGAEIQAIDAVGEV
jgi:hypothetical protein